jgi:hypothetical protein
MICVMSRDSLATLLVCVRVVGKAKVMIEPRWLRIAVHAAVFFIGEPVALERLTLLWIHVVPAIDDGQILSSLP